MARASGTYREYMKNAGRETLHSERVAALSAQGGRGLGRAGTDREVKNKVATSISYSYMPPESVRKHI